MARSSLKPEAVLSEIFRRSGRVLKRCRNLAIGIAALAMLVPSAVAQIGGGAWVPRALAFDVQWPTNAAQSARYWFSNNVYHFLAYSNDGAFSPGNTTLPRTEQRFKPAYTNGVIQYQAMIMAPGNENSYCVFQIHTSQAQSSAFGPTAFMAFWFTNDGGSLHDYGGTTLATHLANKWFQLNVEHNVTTHMIRVWIDKKRIWVQHDNGASDFYIKDGVYEQKHGATYQMDTYLSNILMWTSRDTNLMQGRAN